MFAFLRFFLLRSFVACLLACPLAFLDFSSWSATRGCHSCDAGVPQESKSRWTICLKQQQFLSFFEQTTLQEPVKANKAEVAEKAQTSVKCTATCCKLHVICLSRLVTSPSYVVKYVTKLHNYTVAFWCLLLVLSHDPLCRFVFRICRVAIVIIIVVAVVAAVAAAAVAAATVAAAGGGGVFVFVLFQCLFYFSFSFSCRCGCGCGCCWCCRRCCCCCCCCWHWM